MLMECLTCLQVITGTTCGMNGGLCANARLRAERSLLATNAGFVPQVPPLSTPTHHLRLGYHCFPAIFSWRSQLVQHQTACQ